MRELDAVGLVESAYDLEAPDDRWLEAIVRASAPGLDRGLGMFAMLFGAPGFLRPVAAVIDPVMQDISAQLMANPSPAAARAFTSATVVTSMCAQLARLPDELALWERVARPRGVEDIIGVLAHDGEGGALNLGAPSARRERIGAAARARWSRIAAHFGAALRVRRRRHELSSSVEAVLSRAGRLEHVAPELRDDARAAAALSDGTRKMTRARGTLRRDEQRALAMWPSMVAGRWTLVQRTERDGKQLVEAHANVPRRPPFADLTPFERVCVELARRGHANKEIGYALGVSPSTVGGTLSVAMRKVGVRSRVGLIALGDAPALEDVQRILGARATPAEVAVAALAATGLSNAEIAEQRGVAPRTIANQLARLFERVGVRSRSELAALLHAAR